MDRHPQNMKILNTGSFYGDRSKYIELMSLVKHLKPDVVLLSGDLFAKAPLEVQKNGLSECAEHIRRTARYCDRLFYIFGETDARCWEKTFEEETKNANNVVCLNQSNSLFGGYTFIGLPFVKDTETPLKDWVRADDLTVNWDEGKAHVTTDGGEVKQIENNYEHIVGQKSISEILTEKTNDAALPAILLSHFPPCIDGLHCDFCYNDALTSSLGKFQAVFGGHSKENSVNKTQFRAKFQDCNMFFHGHMKSMLMYNLTVINQNNVLYHYYPINPDTRDIVKNATLYREFD